MATDPLPLDFGRDKPFYVYVYRDPRRGKKRQPIYVGKGMVEHERADSHWRWGTHNQFLATKAIYERDFKRFTAWCNDSGILPIPSSLEVLTKYLAYLEASGFHPNTVERKRAAIRYMHRLAGYDC